jgi:hypothetical protein
LTYSPVGKIQPEDLGVDGKKILQYILEKQDGEAWTGFIWLRIVSSGGLL